VRRHVKEYEDKVDIMEGRGRKGGEAVKEGIQQQRERVKGLDRNRVTAVMVSQARTRFTKLKEGCDYQMSTLGTGVNPITNSDLYSRTDHFVSAATGHQQSNRGGGSSGAATYWEVRSAKMAAQAREKVCTLSTITHLLIRSTQVSDILKGCVFYINGSTGPKMSNLQLQHMITANGGRFLYVQYPFQHSSNLTMLLALCRVPPVHIS
jgi:hypothetical protein